MDNEIFKKFRETLNKSLMLDHAELDFGIYRIMNQKREQITQFLDDDLPQLVERTLTDFIGVDTEDLRRQLADKESEIRAMGLNPSDAIPVKELCERLKDMPDRRASEGHVYDHLARFLARYYVDGDFMPIRRYRSGDTYAIPYDGEEVKLYWANADQYYIKTAEHFRHYAFRTPKGRHVEFTLREASTEQNNNKEAKGQERRFRLAEDNPVEQTGDTLHIYFTYEPMPKATKQKDLVAEALATLAPCLPSDYACLLAPYKAGADRSLLEKHLTDYVSRNTFDYFIHKDLRAFLSRELDFYIKNEMLVIDDIDSRDSRQFLGLLAEAKAVKVIGGKIIDFLAQIENFQKRLWLKRKFVTQADYCITLDRIPAELYPEICANPRQREEWVRLFAIDDIKADLLAPGYSEPLTQAFLEANPHLVLDTALFSADFKHRLLAAIPHIDEQCDGLLINSENFQALRLIEEKYRGKVKCVYIDPPYNTVHSEILYKNNFKHSSWLSLLNNTVSIIENFWTKDFSFGLAIDDFEFTNLSMLLDDKFPQLERSTIIVNHHPQGAGGRLSRTHEYYILLSDSRSPQYLGRPEDANVEDRSFMRSGTAENNYRYGRPKSFYALLYDEESRKIVGAEDYVPLDVEYPKGKTHEGYRRIYPINSRGEERVWRSSYLTGRRRAEDGELWMSDGGSVYQTIDHDDNRKVLFSNWTDSEFNAGTQGSDLIKRMGLGGTFDYPKSIKTIEVGLWAQSFGDLNTLVLDFFAGSGTTGHAVINLNRQDNERGVNAHRRYILVEMGSYFDTVTKPRVMKAAYSADWADGKPVGRQGVSHCFKYLRLEQYEDTLNNLLLPERTDDKGLFAGQFRTDYTLGYLLDVETRDNLLSMEWFEHPFDVTMKITRGAETVEQAVDLVETFNYLIGMTEDTMEWPQDGLCVVQGTMRQGGKTAVVWRDKDKVDEQALTALLTSRRWDAHRIYINGDTAATAKLRSSLAAKVMSTEEEFRSRMFDEED